MINSYANVSFWRRYCDQALASDVARFFPAFWKQQNKWYGEVFPHLEYTDEMALDAAFRWAKRNSSRLANLPWDDEATHLFDDFEVGPREKYFVNISAFAHRYLKSVSPLRPDRSLSANQTDLGDGTRYVRGSLLGDQKTVEKLLSTDDGLLTKYLRWGPLKLELHAAQTSHFCVSGVTRSGKTTLQLLLAQSVLPNNGRVIFFDAKSVLLDRLVRHGSDPLKSFYLLNPFDSRSIAWDIAADANTQHRAKEIAAILFPAYPNDKQFFVDTPRKLLATAIEILNEVNGQEWNFLDLLLTLRSDNIHRTFQRTAAGRRAVATYLSAQNETAINILSSLDARIDSYWPIAAAWSNTEEKLSLRDWAATSTKSLLLGHSLTHQLAMSRINRVIVRLLSDVLLDSQIPKPSRTFVFLDELESLGNIESLADLLNLGAEVGVSMVLGFHDLDTLKSIYGHQTEGMLAMCSHMAFLRLNSSSTAQWAANLLGTQEVCFGERSEALATVQADSAGNNTNQQTMTLAHTLRTTSRHVVSTNQFMELPLTSREVGMTGYFSSHLHPAYRGYIDGEKLFPPAEKKAESFGELAKLLDKGGTGPHLLWDPNEAASFLPRPEEDFEVDADAVPSFVKDEVLAATPLVGEFAESDTPLDTSDSGTSPDATEESPDDDRPDLFDMEWIHLPPYKRDS